MPLADPNAVGTELLVDDPLDEVIRDESHRALLDELAKLDDRDVVALWYHSEGFSDDEIAAVWHDLGLHPSDVTVEAIRKRRQRARERLRRRLSGWS